MLCLCRIREARGARRGAEPAEEADLGDGEGGGGRGRVRGRLAQRGGGTRETTGHCE